MRLKAISHRLALPMVLALLATACLPPRLCRAALQQAGDDALSGALPVQYNLAMPPYPDPALISVIPRQGRRAVVRGQAGATAPGAGIVVYDANDGHYASCTAAADGSFQAEISAPPGAWLLVRSDPLHWRGADAAGGAPFGVNPMPGCWKLVPDGQPTGKESRAGVPFAIEAQPLGVSWSFRGVLSGDFKPGGSVHLKGRIIAGEGGEKPSLSVGAVLKVQLRLTPLFDGRGKAVPEGDLFFSTLLTPTGLPVFVHDHSRRSFHGSREVAIALSGRSSPFEIDYPLPRDLPPGLYALKLRTLGSSGVAAGRKPNALGVQSCLSDGAQTLPPFRIGEPAQPHLVWTLLLDAFNVDSTRGVIAAEDQDWFGLGNDIAMQPPDLILPRLSTMDGRPISYRLEPFLPMISQGDQLIPNPPIIPFKLPSGWLHVRVKRPSGQVDDLGRAPFRAALADTPLFSCGDAALEKGGARLASVFQLSTRSRAFDYAFPEYGQYEIEMIGEVEDLYGRLYSGGGTYKVLVARQLDVKPATLFMTPFQVGDAFNPGAMILPGLPADIEEDVVFAPGSDPAKTARWTIRGKANGHGLFTSKPGDPPVRFQEPGEFRVDVRARYVAPDGTPWAFSGRWGQVVAPRDSPMVVHGHRGRDGAGDLQNPKAWFDSFAGGHMHFPFFSGDVLWQKIGDAAIPGLTVQDEQAGRDIASWEAKGQYYGFPSLDDRARAGLLPLSFATATGDDPEFERAGIKASGYWYAGVERPGEHVREMVSTDQGVIDTGYWRFDGGDAGLQNGIGPEGDLPGDFKFLYGGAVYRDPGANLSRYGIYGALWMRLPDDDAEGARVFPPFQGAGGGPSGGPLLKLAGRDLDAFVVPTAARPGSIFDVGQTFSFAAALAPTVPARVIVAVDGPRGFHREFEGRANPVGYFYDPAADFVLPAPGVYRVSVRAVFDAETSAGPLRPPYPEGSVLNGSGEGSFEIYAVSGEQDLQATPADWRAVQGTGPVRLRFQAPGSGVLHYTIAMPGTELERGTATAKDGVIDVVYDPAKLHQKFPNVDLTGPCEKPGLEDTVWVSALFEGGRGRFHAKRFTLQGPQLFPD